MSATAAAAPPPVFVFDGDGAFNLVLIPSAPSDAESPTYAAPDVKAGEPYRRVDLTGPGETFKASGPGRLDAEHCGAMGELPFVPFAKLPSSDAPYVLVPGGWTPMPKVVPQKETGSYLDVVAQYLKSKGATQAKPRSAACSMPTSMATGRRKRSSRPPATAIRR